MSNLISEVEIGQLKYKNRLYVFNYGIIVCVYKDKCYICEDKLIGIRGFATSLKEAWKIFNIDFDACWSYIAMEEDCNLLLDDKELKRKMIELVNHIEEV